jgi:mono/diheme cytochrome c family protein
MRTIFFKRAPLLLTLIGATIFLMSMSSESKVQAKEAWVAPASADKVANPLKGQPDAIAAGKKLYSTYCAVCHGAKGKGDGIAAAGLNPKPADHTSAKVQNQTDGAIYWKITTGRAPIASMASYEKTLTETQRWQLVDFIRTLKAK